MNVGKLETMLLNAAKNSPPDKRVPYAFEKRIMANLAGLPAKNAWIICGKSLWRAAFSCIVITVLCGIWSFSTVEKSDSETFSQTFECAVYATINQHLDESW